MAEIKKTAKTGNEASFEVSNFLFISVLDVKLGVMIRVTFDRCFINYYTTLI